MGAPRKPDVPHVAPTDEERERGFWKLCRGCDLEWSLANIAASGRCRNCQRKTERSEKSMRTRRGYWLARRYGVTLDDFDAMLALQKNRCAVCEAMLTLPGHGSVQPTDATVDHCRRSGRVRDLLCARCNEILGSVNDDIALLRKLSEYVKRHGAVASPEKARSVVQLPRGRVRPADPEYVAPTSEERQLGLTFWCFRCDREWSLRHRDAATVQCKPCRRESRREEKNLVRHPEQRPAPPPVVIDGVAVPLDDVLKDRVSPEMRRKIDAAIEDAVHGSVVSTPMKRLSKGRT